MDFDNDGILDFISGSYDPGDIYLFRGLGDGEYAKVETILDENEQPLVHHPVEFANYMELKSEDGSASDSDEATSARVASFGSWPAAVDWDEDGDLDMLIGGFGGGIYLRRNTGTRDEPRFDSESIVVEADGKRLKEHSHANPVVADWNGDGKWDLVVGSGDGSVGWYKNIGSVSQPEFAARHQIVPPASDGIFLQQSLASDEDPVPGPRAQICVTDYNGDGLLDLIVGDCSDIEWARELTEDETKEVANLDHQLKESVNKMRELQKLMIDGELADDELEKTESEYDQIVEEQKELQGNLKKYASESRSASFVWLYLRKHVTNEETFVSAPAKIAEPKKSPAADPAAAPTSDPAPDNETAKTDEIKTKNGPVTTVIKLEPTEGDTTRRLLVSFELEPEWHMYVNDDAGTIPLNIELTFPDGIQAASEWQKPEGEISHKNPGAKIYTGTVNFARDIKIDRTGNDQEIGVIISYQVCNEDLCLPPKTIRKVVRVPGSSSD